MFRFLELKLHGWDLWREAHVPLDGDVVLVSGPNGSGKTTLIDAIRQLLNAPRLSSRRRLQHYLRNPSGAALIRAVVSNVDGVAGGSPPFRRERITSPEVTLACALVPGGGGTPEKRFAILPGRPSLADLRRLLLESRDFYPPERYGRALENAGVTRSLMSVLALEQGKTNTLFELRPAELFRKVLEMLGDQAILERYREARRRYEDTERELFRQTSALQGHQAELTRVEREVRRRNEWEEARDKVADLEARLPAAELQRLLAENREAVMKSRELQTKVQRGEAERTAVTARLEAALSAVTEGRAALENGLSVEESARAAWEAAVRAQAEVTVILRQLEERQRELKGIPVGDLAALLREDEEAARALYAAEMEEKSASLQATSAAEKVERLTTGLPDHPEPVTRTLAALELLEIPAVLLPAMIEVVEPRLAESVEAALGDARWALLVATEDEIRAVEVARKHGFPGPVYAGPSLLTGETAGPLALLPGAPAWLPALLESVALLEDGSWSDARGRWVAKVAVRVIGSDAQATALERARAERREAEDTLNEAMAARAATDEHRRVAVEALSTERRRQEILAALAAIDDAWRRERESKADLESARSAFEEAAAGREAVQRSHAAAAEARRAAERDADEVSQRLVGERRALEEMLAAVRQTEAAIAALAERVTPDLRSRAERGELDGLDTVAADLARARHGFALLGDPPPPEVREEERHLHARVAELERHVADRRREADEARSELAECRRRYLEVVSGALADYRTRATEIARAADVAVEMDLPRLVDDDRVLDEAGIHVRFGFDGKEPLPLGDSSFSGGQQVIGGLVLLMAMAETEGRGFFMLDEPFAHLSIDRIDDVGRFLRSTRSQFILTAPTTLDRAQLDPASLVIVLQKKRPDASFAAPPIVAGT